MSESLIYPVVDEIADNALIKANEYEELIINPLNTRKSFGARLVKELIGSNLIPK